VEETQKIPVIVILFWTAVMIVLLLAGVMVVFWNRLPPQLPWFYSLPFGERQLVDKMWFIYIFAGMEAMIVLTRVIANWAGKEDDTVRSTVMIGALAAVILMAASFWRVMAIFLNT
jgi:hypothetical protein